LELNGTSGNIPIEYYKNAFDPVTNPTGKYPRIDADRVGVGLFSDAFVEDGSYIRLKNLQLGYELPSGDHPGHAHGAGVPQRDQTCSRSPATRASTPRSARSARPTCGVWTWGATRSPGFFTAGVTLTF